MDVFALEHEEHHPLDLKCVTSGVIFRIAGDDFLDFLDNNPGAFIWMRDAIVVC